MKTIYENFPSSTKLDKFSKIYFPSKLRILCISHETKSSQEWLDAHGTRSVSNNLSKSSRKWKSTQLPNISGVSTRERNPQSGWAHGNDSVERTLIRSTLRACTHRLSRCNGSIAMNVVARYYVARDPPCRRRTNSYWYHNEEEGRRNVIMETVSRIHDPNFVITSIVNRNP